MHKAQGTLAIFEHPEDLITATKKVRGLRIKKIDAFTPFAVHGLDEAMNLKRSWIPYATLVVALTGACLGFLFQAWALSVSWPVNVGGKPAVSWPAFIPVTFELTILTSGVATAFILLAMCWPFDFLRPALDPRLSDDRFGLFVDKSDPKFDESTLKAIFKECNVEEIKIIG